MKQSEPVFIRNTGSINVLDDLLKSLDAQDKKEGAINADNPEAR